MSERHIYNLYIYIYFMMQFNAGAEDLEQCCVWDCCVSQCGRWDLS